jgi:hypothetical protein
VLEPMQKLESLEGKSSRKHYFFGGVVYSVPSGNQTWQWTIHANLPINYKCFFH